MTFYEAGLAILEKAGHPLTYQEIAAQAVQEGILSHVGQMPEHTMRERLVALARRQADRKVLVVGPGQFALTDWGLPEDGAALIELEGMGEGEPEGPPHRSRERHPAITKSSGSREGAARKRKRRLPPLSTVAQDLLREAASSLAVGDLLERARERGLVSEDLSREMFIGALQEENRRRAKAGKRPLFEVGDGDTVGYLAPAEVPEAVAVSKGETSSIGSGRQPSLAAQSLESRRSAARSVRRLLNELGASGLEQAVTLLLERSGYRDVRPYTPRAAGSGERIRMLTARRKLGLTELRFAVRVVATGEGEVQKEDVQRLRAELALANAHAGLIVGPVDATRDARGESQLVGQPLATLLCADALAEEMVIRQIGCVAYEVIAVNEPFWRDLRKPARSAEGTANRGRSAGPPRPPPRSAEASFGKGSSASAIESVAADESEEAPELEAAPAPEIEQFLNESIAPKPPDAEPLESEAGKLVEPEGPSAEPQG